MKKFICVIVALVVVAGYIFRKHLDSTPVNLGVGEDHSEIDWFSQHAEAGHQTDMIQ